MKFSRLQIVLLAGLLTLLAAFGGLQVVWLGRISEAEKERMTRRLQTDSDRFAEDFNREISTVHSSFQLDPSLWARKSWSEFAEREALWRGRTQYPELIREFYYVPAADNEPVQRYDRRERAFVDAEPTADMRTLTAGVRSSDDGRVESLDPAHAALRVVYFDGGDGFTGLVMSRVAANGSAPPKVLLPKPVGVLVIALDENVIRDRILPDLAAKHFPDGDYDVAVASGDRTVFGTPPIAPDQSAPIFALTADSMIFVGGRDGGSPPGVKLSSVIVNQSSTIRRFETRALDAPPAPLSGDARPANTRIEVRTTGRGPELLRSALTSTPPDAWKLAVTHRAGSIESFTNAAKWRNLGASFAILGLLGACGVLIFVSAQRSRMFAQRQVDFVSSVSHEFRTPLAVIFSAGENLADGVAVERAQVERYGHLIKNEGRKLSAMVEQILEFAGANAGRRKLELSVVDPASIVADALSESATLLEENGFVVEREFAADAPSVRADAGALSRAVQNLIANAVKYSNGTRWIKAGVRADRGGAVIFVEDRGLGVAPEDRSKIFEPFFRSKRVVDGQISGNGLGLSLVDDTVREHGGTIDVESEIDRGSVFSIRLPAAGRESA